MTEVRDAGLRLDDTDFERLFEAGGDPRGDEMAATEYVARYADAVVLDTAPTDHTLRLLDLPAVLSETLGVAGDVHRRVGRTARAARSMVFRPAAYWGGTAGDDADGADDAVVSLRDRIDRVKAFLTDSDRTRFRTVLTSERMAIAETERLVVHCESPTFRWRRSWSTGCSQTLRAVAVVGADRTNDATPNGPRPSSRRSTSRSGASPNSTVKRGGSTPRVG